MQIILENYIPPPCERPRFVPHKHKKTQDVIPNGQEMLNLLTKKKRKDFHVISPSAKLEQQLALMLRSEINRNNFLDRLPIATPCKIIISIFYVENNKPRGDIDNIGKFVMDACQKAGIIKNDALFDDLRIGRHLFEKNGTVIEIEPL